MNTVMLIGNLVRDPEAKTLANGINLTTFTIAVNGRGKDADTTYFRITAWRQLAENCSRFWRRAKKSRCLGACRLAPTRKKDGTGGASLEVNADQVEFLSPKSESGEKTDKQKRHGCCG